MGGLVVHQSDPRIGRRVHHAVNIAFIGGELGEVLADGVLADPVAAIIFTELADGVVGKQVDQFFDWVGNADRAAANKG